MADAVHLTASGGVSVLCLVDDDDPCRDSYVDMARSGLFVLVGPRAGLVDWTNRVATYSASDFPYLASLGDDHLPETTGWDVRLMGAIEAIGGTGIAYGDDTIQGSSLPTAVVMSSNIVRVLGYMAPPELQHLYPDNFWRDLGQAAGCLAYCPDVVIRHEHPIAGRVAWDDSYRVSNSGEQYERDRVAYERYKLERFESDVMKVRMERRACSP
jgi:hypothetical protein